MPSETRLIRPYDGLGVIQGVLDQWVFKLDDEVLPSGSAVSLPEDEFLSTEPRVEFDGTEEDLEAARDELRTAFAGIGIDGEDVDFVVMTTTPRLKLTDLVNWTPVGNELELPREVIVTRDVSRALRTPYGGCLLEVALCLGREIAAELDYPLRPRRRGTWLARTSLSLRPALERAGFPVYPLTPELREQLQLAPDVIRFAKLDTPPLDPADPDSLRVYLDEDLYARVMAQPGSIGSKALQRELWVTAMTTIVLEAVQDADLPAAELNDLGETWVGRLIEWIAGPKRSDQAAWLEILKERPAVFVAQVDVLAQHAVDWKEIV